MGDDAAGPADRGVTGIPEALAEARRTIDNIDAALIHILAERFRCTQRVGHIKACERVPKSNKLLKFTIDDGSGTDRTILSGIAKFYEPEELTGKSVLFVANFAPRKMMGIESQGMILSAENADGSLSVTTVLKPSDPGSQVG